MTKPRAGKSKKVRADLTGPKRADGEAFEAYQVRRKKQNAALRNYLRGHLVWRGEWGTAVSVNGEYRPYGWWRP